MLLEEDFPRGSFLDVSDVIRKWVSLVLIYYCSLRSLLKFYILDLCREFQENIQDQGRMVEHD